MWYAFYALTLVLAAVSTVGLFLWMFYEVFWLHRRATPGARYEPDRAQLRKLQAKRRLALRKLGDRWILHPSQPPVKWGHSRG